MAESLLSAILDQGRTDMLEWAQTFRFSLHLDLKLFEEEGLTESDWCDWCFQVRDMEGGRRIGLVDAFKEAKKHCKTNGDFTNKRQGYQTFLDSVLMIGIVIANKRGRWLPICLVLHSANGMMISLDQSILPHIFVWGSCF